MAFHVVVEYTRPNTDTTWYSNTDQFTTYGNAQAASGNRTSHNVSVSANGLVQTVTTAWKDRSTFNTARASDEIVAHVNARNAYNTTNSISKNKTRFEES